MSIFRQLRWQLTLSYTIVTVSALLVITLFLGGLAFYGLFVPEQALDPEQMIDAWMHNRLGRTYPMWSEILSQSLVDISLLDLYLRDPESYMSGSDLFQIGALQFYVRTKASIRVLTFGPDGVLLGTSTPDIPPYGPRSGAHLTLSRFPAWPRHSRPPWRGSPTRRACIPPWSQTKNMSWRSRSSP